MVSLTHPIDDQTFDTVKKYKLNKKSFVHSRRCISATHGFHELKLLLKDIKG